MVNTNIQYDEAIQLCKEIFIKKTKDYGTSWRVLRTISVVDQIFIKALRIRTIQDLKTQKIGDDIASEFKGIINYAVIGMVQLELKRQMKKRAEALFNCYLVGSNSGSLAFNLVMSSLLDSSSTFISPIKYFIISLIFLKYGID